MAPLHFQPLSTASISAFSNTLSKSTKGLALTQLEQENPKLAAALKAYNSSDTGAYCRVVGNARMECAQLRFGKNMQASGTIVTQTEHRQSLYMPRYTEAAGFLMAEPKKIIAVNDTLNLENPQQESPEQIQAKREYVVKALRAGVIQNRHPRMLGYGSPRQENVNESIINYTPKEIAALVVPESTWRDGNSIKALLDAPKVTSTEGFAQARLTAQLTYITTKLGDLPIVTFNGSEFKNLNISSTDWHQLLTDANALASSPNLGAALNDDYLHSKGTGVTTAMEEVKALEQPFDIEELKHVGGYFTSIPTDIVTTVAYYGLKYLYPETK